MTAFPMRFSPVPGQLASAIRDGALGEVGCLEGVNTGEMPDVMPAGSPIRVAGGGAIMDHVVHLADAYRWLLGVEISEVYAVANGLRALEVVDAAYRSVESGEPVPVQRAE